MVIFGFRLLVAALSIAAVVAYREFFTDSSSISIGIARIVACQEVLLGSSLMTASIPCLKTFLDACTSTGLMTVHGRNIVAYRLPDIKITRSSQTPSKSQICSTPQSPKTPSRPALGHRHSSGVSHRLRPDRVSYKADVQAPDPDEQRKAQGFSSRLARTPESVESFRSDQLAIHRNIEVHVARS